MTTTPSTLAGHVRARLKTCELPAMVVEAPGLQPGHCKACCTASQHPAAVVVTTMFSDTWDFPVRRLDGWSVPCCWPMLAEYMREQTRADHFEGLRIEVPE
jgi:hypothetical protein